MPSGRAALHSHDQSNVSAPRYRRGIQQLIRMSVVLATMNVVDETLERHGASVMMANRYSAPVEEQ